MTRTTWGSGLLVLAGLTAYGVAGVRVAATAESEPAVDEIDVIGGSPPEVGTPSRPIVNNLPEAVPDDSAVAAAALDVLRGSWVWAEIGSPTSATPYQSNEYEDGTVSLTVRLDRAVDFVGELPYIEIVDGPGAMADLPAPNRPTCRPVQDVRPDGTVIEARSKPIEVHNAVVFLLAVDIETECVLMFVPAPPSRGEQPTHDLRNPADMTARAPEGVTIDLSRPSDD
jgi:hypothetical protein